MSITVVILAAIAWFLRDRLRPWLQDISKLIDESIANNDNGFDKLRDDVFKILHQSKHPLGKDGFEKLT